MDKILSTLDKRLSPIGEKLGTQRHLQSIANGMMMTLPLLVIGSLFLLLANPPIDMNLIDTNTNNIILRFLINWKMWATEFQSIILAPYDMTYGMLGLFTSFGISYSLSKYYKMDAATNGIISSAIFLLVCATTTTLQIGESTVSAITTKYLGSDGLIISIFIGLLTVEFTHLLNKLNLNIKFPSSVPSMVTTFVNSLLPLLINILLFYGLNLLIIMNTGQSFPEFINSLLTPVIDVGNNVWVYALIILFGNLLWFLGVNGTSIIFPIVFTLGLNGTVDNANAIKDGLESMTAMNLQLFRYAMIGGTGGTLGLILLMWRSKSSKLKSIARISVVPGICSINEPVTFGVPIVYNPILAIPYILSPSICVIIGYFAQEIGIVNYGYNADPSFIPFFIQGWISGGDIRNVLLMIFMIILCAVLYFPFYKIYEKNVIQEELNTIEEENENDFLL